MNETADLHRVADEQAALRRVATLVARGAEPADVFDAVAEETARILDVPATTILSFQEGGSATKVGGFGLENPFPVGGRYPPHAGVVAEVWHTGLPARVDYRELAGAIPETLEEAGIRTGLGVPIVAGGSTWGVVVALATERRPLPADAEDRLAAFTELVSVAIANTQAHADLRRLADEQAALRRVAVLVARGAMPEEVFAAVAEQLARLLDAPAISMVRFEPDGTSTAIAVWGDDNPFGTGARFDPHPGVMLRVRETGRPARLEDFADSTGPTTARLEAAGIRSGVGVPIVVEGTIWGATIALATRNRTLPEGIEPRLSSFTELVATAIANTQARDDLHALADEQAALRRVATLVAAGAEPQAVFDAVCEETGRLLGATSTNLAHFTSDRFNLTIAGWSLRDTHIPTGTRLPLGGDTINTLVQRTGAPARFDSYVGAGGELAALIRERGIHAEVGAPVIVDGQVWGGLIAGWDVPEPATAGTELRLARFAELVATAVSNAATRSQLIASRARIVAAADEARRRIERNLHDGAQQQLVSLGLELQAVKAKLPPDADAAADLERIRRTVDGVIDEVREISRGVHPAALSHWGLGPALRSLARRSSVPVELSVGVAGRLPQSIEIAAYYVVSEALANVAKHAGASSAAVTVAESDGRLLATIRDDGAGGAVAAAGSGLAGLVDRVEALGGRLVLASPHGEGTTISIELPLDDANAAPLSGR